MIYVSGLIAIARRVNSLTVTSFDDRYLAMASSAPTAFSQANPLSFKLTNLSFCRNRRQSK